MNSVDAFERLGLPRRFDLSPTDIEREYLRRSREFHPDFHGQSSTSQQNEILELSSAVNEAYFILREPFRRANYLLSLEGGPSASDLKQMPQAFLMEMLELREQLEELRQSGSSLDKMEEDLEARREEMLANVGKKFLLLEQPGSPRGELLNQIRQLLNGTKYLENLLRDLRE